PLACRPSPPQGGRIFAAGSRFHFCVLPVASFGHANVKPFTICPQGNGPVRGSEYALVCSPQG
ncbi:hypothetical protein CN087_17740, partial [Sinorhizobium meliloti]